MPRPTSSEEISAPAPEKRERDVALDALRGLCIALMVCNHVAHGGYLNRLLHAPLFINGAMGFVFLSGFVRGMIHRRRVERDGALPALLHVEKRAGQIWLVHLVLAGSIVLLHGAFGLFSPQASVTEMGGTLSTSFLVAFLRYQPPYNEILPLYIVYLILAGPLLNLAVRGRKGLLAAAFGIIYLASQVWPGFFDIALEFPGGGGRERGLNLGAWQALFFGGMLLGIARAEERTHWLTHHWRFWLLLSTTIFTAFFTLSQLYRPRFAGIDVLPRSLDLLLVDHSRFGPLALLYFASAALPLYAAAGYLLVAHPVSGWICRRLAEIGAKSLYTYILHFAFLTVAVVFGLKSLTWYWQDIFALFSLALLLLMARHNVLRPWIPN